MRSQVVTAAPLVLVGVMTEILVGPVPTGHEHDVFGRWKPALLCVTVPVQIMTKRYLTPFVGFNPHGLKGNAFH